MVWDDVRFLGKEGGLPACGLGTKRPASNAVIGPKAWRIMYPTPLMVQTSTRFDDGVGWFSPFEIWERRGSYMRKLLRLYYIEADNT